MTTASLNGRICYVELPATDVARSADFYSGLQLEDALARRRRDPGGNVMGLYQEPAAR